MIDQPNVSWKHTVYKMLERIHLLNWLYECCRWALDASGMGKAFMVASTVVGGLSVSLVAHLRIAALWQLILIGAAAGVVFLLCTVAILYEFRVGDTSPVPRSVTAGVEKLGEIRFNYLPRESPLENEWKLLKEDRPGVPPSFAALPPDAPVPVGLSISSSGWYGMDYPIVDAYQAGCNRLKFAAKFGTDGRIYTLVQMRSRKHGQKPVDRWIQMGVNVGPSCVEGNECIVSVIGKPLANGWISFDVSLDDQVTSTFGKQEFFYGEHGKLLKIRLRGSLSISEIELYRG